MKTQDLMTRTVAFIEPQKSIKQAAQKMRDLQIGSLPVMKDGMLLGIITDRDICCRAIAMGRDPVMTEVQDVMNRDVATCYDDDDIGKAAQLMEDRHVRRLAVLHHDKTMAGILSVDDLARSSHDLAGAVLEAATPIH
jgi:predicted transcriptional regulator